MNWIYRLNWWYDDQPEPRRFFMFIIPMVIFQLMFYQHWSTTISITGILCLCAFAVLRVVPFAFPRKRPS